MDVLYRTLSRVPPPHSTAWVSEVLGVATGGLGALVGSSLSRDHDGGRGSCLVFLPQGAPAPDPAARAGAVEVGPARRYRIALGQVGPAPRTPAFLQLTVFDGPRDERWSAALHRAGAERIGPAVRSVPGVTGSLLCVAPDGAAHALTLAVSVEALEEALRAVMSTALLPGEDPALLTGPDRVDVHRLVHVDLPAPARLPAPPAGVPAGRS